MSDTSRESWQVEALKACLRDLGGERELDVRQQVRLVAMLLSELLEFASESGVDGAELAALKPELRSVAQAMLAAKAGALAGEGGAIGGIEAPSPASTDAQLPAPPSSFGDLEPEAEDAYALFSGEPIAAEEPNVADGMGLEVVPGVALDDPAPIESEAVRRAPRYAVNSEVMVLVDGQEWPARLPVRDISRGGVFLATSSPPALDTMLRVQLQTSDGPLELYGKVVRIVSAEDAAAVGVEAGVGVQFSGLDDQRRLSLERYVESCAPKKEQTSAVVDIEPSVDVVAKIQWFISCIDESSLYEAIGARPSASSDELKAKIEEFRFMLSGAAVKQAGLPEAQIHGVIRSLERISEIMLVEASRLAHDFAHGHVRAEERLAACRARGETPDSLRSVWHSVFPDQLQQAQSLFEQAAVKARAYDYEAAYQLASQAMVFDPFNEVLRDRVGRCDVMRTIAQECRDNSLDAEARLSWAAERGIDAGELRGLWREIRPEETARAEQIAGRVATAARGGQIDQAIAAAAEALALDPFNPKLRGAMAKLRQMS